MSFFLQHAKRHFSQACRLNGNNQWVRLIPEFVRFHNSQPVTNTSVKRSSVTKHNYVALLSELFRTEAPTMLFNISATEDHPEPLAKLIFKYQEQDKVLLARRVNFTLKNRNSFEKESVVGAFGSKVYTISRRMAKHNADLWITPVYQLAEIPGSWWYTSELSPALYAENKGGDKEEARRRQRRREQLRLRRLRARRTVVT